MFRSDIECRICKLYEFEDIVWIGELGGLSGVNYEIETDRGRFILKKYRSSRLEDILKIERVSNFLSENNLPVLPAVFDKYKSSHFVFNNELFGVFPKTEGIILHEPTLSESTLRLVSSLLARLHRLKSSSLDLSFSKQRVVPKKIVEEEANKILCLVADHPLGVEADQLTQKLIKKKTEAIHSFGSLDFFQPYLQLDHLVHGDFHNENILFNKNLTGIVRLLDFEETHSGHRVEDVIHFIMLACCNTGYQEENLRKARFFLQSYQSFFPLEKEEIVFGVYFELYREFSSFFLEKILYLKRDLSLVKFLERDLKKILYFSDNLNTFLKDLC